MHFKDVKPKKQTALKLVNLYNNPLIGTYIRKENSLHSVIYIIRKLDNSEVGVYGSKSLDTFISDSLLGKVIKIECIDIRTTASGHAFGVAKVQVNEDEEIPEYTFSEQEGIEDQPEPDLSDCEIPEYDR